MSAEHGMSSETEETEKPTRSADIQEDTVPGSSPEEVFPNEENHIFVEHEENPAPHHLPLQVEELKHGEEIVDQQTDGVDQGEIIVEEEHQYENMVQISQEDMYEAGFDLEDLNHLTEEQLNTVIAISQQRQAKQDGHGQNEEVVEEGAHHQMIHHEMIENHFEGEHTSGHGNDYEGDDGRPQMGENSVQITLTSEGGVTITDTKQQEYYISPSIIENLNIDLNALSNDHVNQLLQMAIPSLKNSTVKTEESTYSREEVDDAPSTSYHHHHNEVEPEKVSRSPIIGETVQIRTPDGQIQDAVVKYYKGHSEYKIQFMGGEFAYATLDQIQVPQRTRGDHDNYQIAAPVLVRRADVAHHAQKRSATSNELCPPLLKRSYHLAPVVDGPHIVPVPNFCCPICDKKVFQKEPSYIVIRLPACDSCTREKIIVLDEQNS